MHGSAHALELALRKIVCVLSSSAPLSRSGEFEQQPHKRCNGSGPMVAELLNHGPDSPEGRAVIGLLNRIQSEYAKANASFPSAFSGFVAEPLRLLAR